MGVEAFIAPLIGAVGNYASAKANAAAAQAQNKETMDFNRKEAEKARKWQAQQAVIDRNYNSAQQATARKWAVEQSDVSFDRTKELQLMAQNFNSNEAATARAFDARQAAIARAFNSSEAEISRNFNATEAQKARNFDKMMSNTAHQREMADLKAAGLNPILAAGSGAPIGSVVSAMSSPASTSAVTGPSASIGYGSAPMASGSGAASHNSSASAMAAFNGGHKVNGASMLGSLLSSAVEGVRLDNDIKRANATVVSAEAERENSKTNALNGIQNRIESNARVLNIKETTELNKLKQITEKELANKVYQEALKVIQEKTDNHEVAQATKDKLKSDSAAYASAMYAQAGLASTRAELERAKNPEEIAALRKEADLKQEQINRYKFDMSDPETLARREYYSSDGKLKVGFKEIFGSSAFTAAVIKSIK